MLRWQYAEYFCLGTIDILGSNCYQALKKVAKQRVYQSDGLRLQDVEFSLYQHNSPVENMIWVARESV